MMEKLIKEVFGEEYVETYNEILKKEQPKMESLEKIIKKENKIENLKNIIKQAEKDNLPHIIKLCNDRLVEIRKELLKKAVIKNKKKNNNPLLDKSLIKKCYSCGKEIDFLLKTKEDYVWKIRNTFFCSHSCYKKVNDKIKRRRRV